MLDDNLRKRAEENDVQAVFDLAMAYFIGEEVEEDNDKAFSLFCKVIALDPDFTNVYSRIGRCYENGWGTQQNLGKAIEMFTKVLNTTAAHAITIWHSRMKREKVSLKTINWQFTTIGLQQSWVTPTLWSNWEIAIDVE